MHNLPPTKILASIKSFNEAMLVLNKGIDIIDFKNPALGTLGALPIDKIKSCLKVIPSEQLTSATIGDIYDIEEIKKELFDHYGFQGSQLPYCPWKFLIADLLISFPRQI